MNVMNVLSGRFFTLGSLLWLVACVHDSYGQPHATQTSDHNVSRVQVEASAQSLGFGVPLPGPDRSPHQIQNLALDELARDRVGLSCAIVLPLRVLGAAGSPVRPIAIGVPRR